MTRPIDDAREKLLNEGRRRLQEQGCETLGVKSLTDACGMAAGTFYSYFANKNEFIFAVLGIDWDEVIATAEALVDTPLPLREKLKKVFEILNTFEHTYWMVFWQLSNADEAGRLYREEELSRMYGCVARIIERGIADGSIKGIPIPLDKFSRLVVHELVSLAVHDDIAFDEFFDCLLLESDDAKPGASGDTKSDASEDTKPDASKSTGTAVEGARSYASKGISAIDRAALMLSEQRYRHELAIFHAHDEKNLIAKGRHDLTDNRVLEYIPASGKALDLPDGYPYDEAYKSFIKMPTHENSREELADIFDRTNLIDRFKEGRTYFSLDYRREKDHHTTSWVHAEAKTFLESNTGHIECFIYTYDQTEKHLEQQVITKLTELGYDYIGIIDRNQGSLSCYGVGHSQNSDILSQNEIDYASYIRDIVISRVAPEDADTVQHACSLETIVDVLSQRPSYAFAFSASDKNDGPRRKLLRFCYIDDEAQQLILICGSDITDQYAQEQQQIEELRKAKLETDRAAEAESMFLSSMSHDMRTPLNGILGFTRLALQTDDGDKKQDYLQKIDASGHLMLDLVNDVLDLSKMASGRMELHPTVVDGQTLSDDILANIRQAAQDKDIEVIVDTKKASFCPIRIDKLRAQQVLLNLLSNAVKYTPRGGKVWYTLEDHTPDKEGRSLRVTVRDNGIGISREFLPHLFEPFSQEHSAMTSDIQGTGLGLSIVKKIVDLMEGTIEAASQKGKGTTFTVEIPIERIPCSQGVPREEDGGGPEIEPDFTGRRVLLCEDNYLNAEIAEILLKEKGIDVVTVTDGKAGLEAFKAGENGFFDAILMDVRMPVMDGLEATRAIRGLDRVDAKSVPIVAMTADAYTEDIERCREAGMDAHVSKPIDIKRLFKTLSKAMGISGTRPSPSDR